MTDGSDEGSISLVGTAHVSAESASEVQAAVADTEPDVVAVELDEGRYRQLRGDTPEDLEPSDLLSGSVAFQLLAYWLLSYVQARLGDRFDIEPGADMRAAIDAAEAIGADIALVDRDIQVTVQRFWARLSFIEKLQLLGGLALGATGLPVAGLAGGVLLGLVVGPVVAVASWPVHIPAAVLVSLVGGVAVTIVGAYLLDGLIADSTLAAVIGLGCGAILGPLLGWTDPIVTAVLGSLALRLVGGILGGMIALGGVGMLVGLLAGSFQDNTIRRVDEFDIEELTDADVVTALVEEFRQFSPGGAEALIDERDAYIAHELLDLKARGKNVVAVVGAGHRAGIENFLANPETLPPRASLTGEASNRLSLGTVLGTLISASFLVLFGLLIMSDVALSVLVGVVAAWVLYNGLFAVVLAKLAGARWSSALVGGSVAWLTSLNPLLAPGWFAGYVELRTLPVRISDISTLNELLDDDERPIRDLLGDMLDVPLFKLVAVVALTNIGSFLASISFPIVILPLLGGPFDSVADLTAALSEGLDNTMELLGGIL